MACSSFLSAAIVCVVVAATVDRTGAQQPTNQVVFVSYDDTTMQECKTFFDASPCAKVCTRVYNVKQNRETKTKEATLTPSKALMPDRCMAKAALCGVGTGTFGNGKDATEITFSQPKSPERKYTVSSVGNPQAGFKLTFPKPNGGGGCIANYALTKNGEVITEKYRDADINWPKVIAREDLLKKTGAKTGGSNALAKEMATKTNTDIVAMAPPLTAAKKTPASYSVHEAHPHCKPTILDQGDCGSCWAFSTTGVLAQRLCLASGDISGLSLSPQAQITCNTGCFNALTGKTGCKDGAANCICQGGCDGGYTEQAFDYMRTVGVTTDLCVPYTSAAGTNPMDGKCTGTTTDTVFGLVNQCKKAEQTDDDVTFKAVETYVLETDAEIQRDIFINGPVQATLIVETPLYGYTSGVFSCDGEEGNDGGHAVIMVGWGEEGGVKYWLLQNSWGPEWGDNGYFKVIRGANDDVTSCSITKYINTALPDTNGVSYNKTAVTNAPGTGTDTGDDAKSSATATPCRVVYTAAMAVVATCMAATL